MQDLIQTVIGPKQTGGSNHQSLQNDASSSSQRQQSGTLSVKQGKRVAGPGSPAARQGSLGQRRDSRRQDSWKNQSIRRTIQASARPNQHPNKIPADLAKTKTVEPSVGSSRQRSQEQTCASSGHTPQPCPDRLIQNDHLDPVDGSKTGSSIGAPADINASPTHS